MFVRFQVVFDAHDAVSLADFWSTALGYVLQPPPSGFETWEEFADAIEMPEEERNAVAAIVDRTGEGPRILFLNVPEGKTAKNRVHLDVHVGDGPDDTDIEAKVDTKVTELVAAGATRVERRNGFGSSWVVMLDPEGNEFCVA